MKKILDCVIVIVSLAVGFVVFGKFDMEGILWNRSEQSAVSSQEIEENHGTDHTGKPAGDGITKIDSQSGWEAVLNDVDYVTVTPKGIEKTDVYSLAEWSDHFNRRKSGAAGRRKAEVRQSAWDISLDYSPYYIIELEDGSHILAQMNRCIAGEIEKGKEIALPLGQKKGFSQEAKNLLAPVCETYQVPADYVLYTIDNEWQSEHSFGIFIGKFIAAAIVFFILAVVLELLAEKFFKGNTNTGAGDLK